MSMQDIAFSAKQLSRTHHSGVLGTHSTSMPGYPFGSVVPYYLTPAGDAIIYISDIALHTRNIKANDKVSLTRAFRTSVEVSQMDSNGMNQVASSLPQCIPSGNALCIIGCSIFTPILCCKINCMAS